MILETTFIIDLMNGNPEAIEKIKQINETQFITTPTIFELWSGIAQSKKPVQEKKKILAVLESQLVLNLDKESSEEAGEIDGTLIKEGQQIDPEDSMIAGIAKAYGEKILTRNVSHFDRIKGIEIETY